MDIRLSGATPDPAEVAALDRLLGREEADGAAAPGAAGRDRRHLLLPALQALQAERGGISRGGLEEICRRLVVPPAEAYSVATFYHLLSVEAAPPRSVQVCDDIACLAAGAGRLCQELESRSGPAGTPVGSGSRTAAWYRSPCLGLCDRAPAALLTQAGAPAERFEVPAGPVTAAQVAGWLAGARPAAGGAAPPARQGSGSAAGSGPASPRLLARIGRIDPEHIDAYRAAGGYAALRRAIEIGAEAVLREVAESRLVGRGGAAFPVARKWEAVARSPVRPHHLVCNADESEPGTFKDRVLMEGDPFALVEAVTIAAITTGCEQAWVYVRGEYPVAALRLEGAIAQARARGLLGPDVMGSGLRVEIEVRRGAGAYVCGEETALFNSIEGRRGEPRNKPPFPVHAGLFRRPTVVNNVETLACIPGIVLEGGAAFAAIGTSGSTGTKLFCVTGRVRRPGVYEVPFGATAADLIRLAGGVVAEAAPRAVLLGGAAGSFIGPDQLDLPLTFEATRAAGLSLGSGALVVFDSGTDLPAVVLRIARFFREESCGQCVPCRVGTVRQEEALRRRIRGAGGEEAVLGDLARVMSDASICGLGQTASSAVLSAIRMGLV